MNFNLYPTLDYASYLPPPSAPPLEEIQTSPINWSALPLVGRNLKWHEDSHIRQIVGDIFLSLGTLSGAATAFSATYLLPPPLWKMS